MYIICTNINTVYRHKCLVYNGILKVLSNYRLPLIRYVQKDNIQHEIIIINDNDFSLIYNIFLILLTLFICLHISINKM